MWVEIPLEDIKQNNFVAEVLIVQKDGFYFEEIKHNKKSATRKVKQEEYNSKRKPDVGVDHSRTPKKMVPNVIPKINSTGVGGIYIHL